MCEVTETVAPQSLAEHSPHTSQVSSLTKVLVSKRFN